MPTTTKDLVDKHLANTTPNYNARPATPEPTTASGTVPEHALYDSPQEGSQSTEFRQGRRKRCSTERGELWANTFNRSEDIRKKGNRTRKINAARRSHERQPQPPGNSSEVPQDNDSPGLVPAQSSPEPEPLPERLQRGRTRTIHCISRSPTPGSTDHELEETTQSPTFNSQYTFVYETLDHKGLVKYAQEEFGINGHGCDTQTILAKLRLAEGQQKTQFGSSRQPPSIKTHPGQPLQVGGGWHHEFTATQSQESRGTKRGQGTSNGLLASNKKQRIKQTLDYETGTEPETDEWPKQNEGPTQVTTRPILGPFPSPLLDLNLGQGSSLDGTHPPPPSPADSLLLRESTPTTIPATQDSRPTSFYGKSMTPNSPLPSIPTLLSTQRNPTNNCFPAKFAQSVTPAEHEEADEVPEPDTGSPTGSHNGLPKEASSGPFTQNIIPLRTYQGNRSHLPSRSHTNLARSSNNPKPTLRPNSPNLTMAELIRKERTIAIMAKALAKARNPTTTHRQVHPLLAEASAPPTAHPQSRPLPGASGITPGTRTRGTRRINPIGAARAEMIAFNKACARQEAHSFIESTTHQSKRTAGCAPPSSRPRDGYLEDNEELLAQAEAFAKKKWPNSTARPRPCNRKSKPLACDVSGIERQALVMSKIHLFAYGLVQGIYQTRATFLRWAASVHHATWKMELPTTPYGQPPHDIFEIMVNNIATMHGKVKEHLCSFTASQAGFRQRQTNQEVIQENLVKFNRIYPNGFHCKSYCPRKGHYENPEIGQCIAIALFDGPSSVGVMYPDYFRDMPLNVVAFVLAMWQFCIEEWSNGWHQNGDLGMAAMREKYEAQLAGLKELRDIAPRRMDQLQTEWRDHVMEYSGAQLKHEEEDKMEGVICSEMRPDTPEPEPTNAMNVEEIDDQMFQTASQISMQEHMQLIIDQEEHNNDFDIPTDEEEDVEPTPTPLPIEYDSQGRLTACAKGKGRAN